MREQVIIQSIRISKRNEQRFFQVKLPADTKRIIGIETGLYTESELPYFWAYHQPGNTIIRQNRLMGVLQLRSLDKPNLFYSKEIFDKDINIGLNELKIINEQISPRRVFEPVELIAPVLNENRFFDFSIWSHGTKREEDPLNVCGCTIISGQFKDAIGEYYWMNLAYTVMLYIWIERNVNNPL